jgi:hypothetical protein
MKNEFEQLFTIEAWEEIKNQDTKESEVRIKKAKENTESFAVNQEEVF